MGHPFCGEVGCKLRLESVNCSGNMIRTYTHIWFETFGSMVSPMMHLRQRCRGGYSPVIKPRCLLLTSSLSSTRSKNLSSPCALCVLGMFMKVRTRVPIPPITMTEPIRHGRLGGNGSVESAISGDYWEARGHLDRLSMLLCLDSRGRSFKGGTKNGTSFFFAER